MNGTRLPDGDPNPWPPPHGAYWRMERLTAPHTFTWHAVTPNGLFGNLANHTVIEHDDRTITVSPSILVTHDRSDGPRQWHGYLERGIWREC